MHIYEIYEMFPESPRRMRCHSYHGVAAPGSGNLRTSRAFIMYHSILGAVHGISATLEVSNVYTVHCTCQQFNITWWSITKIGSRSSIHSPLSVNSAYNFPRCNNVISYVNRQWNWVIYFYCEMILLHWFNA